MIKIGLKSFPGIPRVPQVRVCNAGMGSRETAKNYWRLEQKRCFKNNFINKQIQIIEHININILVVHVQIGNRERLSRVVNKQMPPRAAESVKHHHRHPSSTYAATATATAGVMWTVNKRLKLHFAQQVEKTVFI